MLFATIPLHSLLFSPIPICLFVGIRGCALSVLCYTAISEKNLFFLDGTR